MALEKHAGSTLAAVLAVTGGVPALCQSAGPKFESISIRRSPPPGSAERPYGRQGGPGSSTPTRITWNDANMIDLVTTAYGIDYYRLSGLGAPRDLPWFDIAVRLPQGATGSQVQQMWRSLLADRFQFAAHRSTKEMPVEALVVWRRAD